MLLDSKTGIKCDHCPTTLENDFTYYSLDTIENGTNILSLDICLSCIKNYIEKLTKFFDPTMTKCELSGRPLDKKYVCTLTKVYVNYTHSVPQCNKCGKTSCGCADKVMIKKASVKQDQDKVSVNICSETKTELLAQLESSRL